jgi:hypothetical protein
VQGKSEPITRNLTDLCTPEFDFTTFDGNARWVGAYMFYEGSEEWKYMTDV